MSKKGDGRWSFTYSPGCFRKSAILLYAASVCTYTCSIRPQEYLALPHHRDRTELLHQAEEVPLHPALDHLAARNAKDLDVRNRHMFAGCGDGHESPLLRSTDGEACRDLVPLCDQVLNCVVQV